MVAVPTSSVLDAGDAELVLRICSPARRGQIVRLKSAKCTIGSGPRCTLRLRARRVRPLHCLILRGAQATVIRRWAPDTRLNGRPFSEAMLNPGDRITVGPIEFEVLPAGQPHDERLAQPDKDERLAQPDKSANLRPTDPRDRRELDQVVRRLESARRHSRMRARRLLAELRSAREQIARLQQQQEALNAQVEETGRTQPDLEAQDRAHVDAVPEDLDRWEAERAEQDQRLRRQSEQLDARQGQLDARQQDLQQQEARLRAEKAEAENRLQTLDKEVRKHQAELDQRSNALRDERQQWDVERTEAIRQLEERSQALTTRSEQLDARADELDAREARLHEQLRQLETEQGPDDVQDAQPAAPAEQRPEVQTEHPSPDAPKSSEEVFRRMGLTPSFDDEELEDEPSPTDPPPEPSPETPAPPSDSEGSEEESIDQYMARLLKRVQETTERPAEAPAESDASSEETGSPSESDDSSEPSDAPPEQEEPPEDRSGSTQPSRRAAPAERWVDLTALRELANYSAHSAINTHTRRVMFGVLTGKLLVTIVALIATSVLTWIWWTRVPDDRILYAAGVCLVISLFWGVHYAVLLRYLAPKTPDSEAKKPNTDNESTEKPKTQTQTGHGEQEAALLASLAEDPNLEPR